MLDFDIVTRDEQSALTFGKCNIYINYDANTFGANLVSGNYIMATKGSLIASPDYLMTLTDQAANTLKLSVDHVLNPTTLNTLGLVDQQLAHLSLFISNNGSTGNVAFDNGMMQGNTDYWDNSTATDQSYQVVNVGSLISTPASQDILTYTLGNDTYTYSGIGDPTGLDFDVTAITNHSNPLMDAGFIIQYDRTVVTPISETVPLFPSNTYSANSMCATTGDPVYSTTYSTDPNPTNGSGTYSYLQFQYTHTPPFDYADGGTHYFPSGSNAETFTTIHMDVLRCADPKIVLFTTTPTSTGAALGPVANNYSVPGAGGGCSFTPTAYSILNPGGISAPTCMFTGIVDLSQDKANSLRAYPSPFSTQLSVSFQTSVAGPIYAEISDMLGQIVYRQPLGSLSIGTYHRQLNISADIPAGVYSLKLSGSGIDRSIKIIKQ